MDSDPIDVEIPKTCTPDGGQDAAPVGIGRKERRLDQRRMGDGVGDRAGLLEIGGVFDLHGHQLGRALAVAHDGGRQLDTDGLDGALQCGEFGDAPSRISRIAAGPGRGQHAGVVGRGVAVDGDGVERAIRPPSRSTACSRSGATAASVARKASMVAMFGQIMPAPLAMPVIVAV